LESLETRLSFGNATTHGHRHFVEVAYVNCIERIYDDDDDDDFILISETFVDPDEPPGAAATPEFASNFSYNARDL